LPNALPSSTQALAYDGTNWTFKPLSSGGSVTSVTGTSPITITNATTTPAISITQASAANNGYLSFTDWTTFNSKLSSGATAGGDLSGTLPNPTIASIRGINIATAAPTTNQVLQYNGTSWTPTTLAAGLTNPMTGNGDIIFGGTSGAPTRLGTATGFLKGGTTPSWSSINLTSDVTGTLPIGTGGTGVTITPANGQLLIGNGTGYTVSTLTGGSGVTITNSAGGISISSSGLTNPMTTAGDILYGGVSGTATRLGTGTGFLKAGTTPTWAPVDLASSDVSGTLPISSGGTGATTIAGARSALGLGSLSTLNGVDASQITDGAITNADISSTAAIAGSKLVPAFGTRDISTTGLLSSGNITTTNLASINSVNYTWPASQGAASSVLTNNGSGVLSWATAAASTALITSNAIPKGNGTTQVASSLTDNGTTVSSSNDFNLAAGKVIKVNNSTVFSTLGSNNLFAGEQTAVANTGINNTFLGFLAGTNNTSAGDNVFVGSNAGHAVTTGNSNTFIGSGAGQTNNAYLSVFVGFKAGRAANQGGNVFIGASAGENATGGLNNFIGENAGVNTSTGSQNTFVGRNAGAANTTGSAIVLLGNESNVGAANLNNATAIGPSAIVSADNSMVLGSVGTAIGIGTTTPDATVSLDVVSAKGGFVASFDRNIASGSGILGFYRQGALQGNISESAGTISYNTFTGSHFATSPVALTLGTLVTLTGNTEYMKDNADPVYEVIPSHQPNDPRLLGSFLHDADEDIKVNNKTIRTIMSVGNGIMWVADNGENIEPGDYLISSAVEGHAMKDRGQYEITYIIARAGEPVQWEKETATTGDVKHKKISVFYESFVRNYKAEKLEKELSTLQQQVNTLKKDSAEQMGQMKTELENLKKMLMAFSNN
jgi:hypothetical protein